MVRVNIIRMLARNANRLDELLSGCVATVWSSHLKFNLDLPGWPCKWFFRVLALLVSIGRSRKFLQSVFLGRTFDVHRILVYQPRERDEIHKDAKMQIQDSLMKIKSSPIETFN